MNYVICRHRGSIDYLRSCISLDTNARFCSHLTPLDLQSITPRDTVIGFLPLHLASAICQKGARFLTLSFDIPANLRGKELNSQQLSELNPTLKEYVVTEQPPKQKPEPPCAAFDILGY